MTDLVRIALHAPAGEAAAWGAAVALANAWLAGSTELVLEPHPDPEAVATSGAPVLAFSLQAALADPAAFATIAAEWRARAARLAAGPLARGDVAFISTIFRGLPTGQAHAMARLRRLNLLAAGLSQAHGLLVIDLDRVIAHRGGLALRTDATLAGEAGPQAAAQVMAGALLSDALFRFVPDETLDAAIAAHAAQQGAEIERLTVPVQLIRRRVTAVGRRRQESYAPQHQFDDRALRGLWRDLRRRRIGPAEFFGGFWRKIAERIEAASLAFKGRGG